MVDPAELTATSLVGLLSSRSVSAVEVVESVLNRLELTEPLIHAYARVRAEEAVEEARRLDDELIGDGSTKPLHGVPFAVKDVLWTRDMPTEAGSRILAGFRPSEDAAAVRLLRDAGGILIGKHVAHEFATDPTIPETRNAWNPQHYAGGSSAGAGASVAVGSALAALGTDAGGSTRKPAALNGMVGLKPTYDRINRHGVVPPSGSMDAIGVVTRTVEDCDRMLNVLCPPGPRASPGVDDPAERGKPQLGGVRIGLCDYFFDTRLQDEVRAPVEDALDELQGIGAALLRVDLPSLRLVSPAGFTIFLTEGSLAHREWLRERRHDYRPATRQALELGLALPAAHLVAAQRARAAICDELADAFRSHRLDALATPTLPIPSRAVEEIDVGTYLHEYTAYTMPANLAGLPAITVPCGTTALGLPVGLQLVGRPFDEATLLRIGRAFERATTWHELRPPIHQVA